MSRSARNRAARNLRSVTPRGTVGVHTAARPHHVMLDDPHQNGRIRCVGYLGRNPTSVSYAGSGEAGYTSAWAGSQDFYTDPRWSQTVSNQDNTPIQTVHLTAGKGPAYKAGKGKR
jgi:hypothetical protein